MNKRLIAGGAALAVVVAVVALALAAADNSGTRPEVLPVLGTGRTGAERSSAMPASDMAVRPGSIRYEAKGDLPALDGDADAWELHRGRASESQVATLAKVLGVNGSAERNEAGWVVAEGGRQLQVYDQPGRPWNVYEMEAASGASGSGVSGSAVASSGTVVACPQPPPDCPPNARCAVCTSPEPQPSPEPVPAPREPERPAGMPTKAEAERIGRELLRDTGTDLDGATVRVEDGFSVWQVTVDPHVGGVPTVGWTSAVGVGPEGRVTFANGWLDDPSKGDRYPLIGTKKGLERLNEQQGDVRILGLPARGAADGPAVDQCVDCQPPGSTEPHVVDVTGVHLALQLYGGFDQQRAWLVPSYVFETAEGEPAVIAVADEYLAKPPTAPVPSEPGKPTQPDRPPPPSSEGQCSASASAGSPGGGQQAPSVEVCGPAEAKVGEKVVFRVSAKDPDSGIRHDCGSPVVAFGDEEGGVATCAIGCESLPPGPGELSKSYEHAYTKAGKYAVTVSLLACGDDHVNRASVQLAIAVST